MIQTIKKRQIRLNGSTIMKNAYRIKKVKNYCYGKKNSIRKIFPTFRLL